MKNQKYYLGLDVGTNSVGYAVTDEEYRLLKFKGEPMWGAHTFEEGKQCADRRGFRTARRRLNRRQQRVRLVQEIFAKEIQKVDERFFIRLQESALYREDTTGKDDYIFFNDSEYSDKHFHEDYPTIHHLIVALMKEEKPHDVRLVYLAVAWLVAHRGHFLSEVDKDNVEKVLDFDEVYNRFLVSFGNYDEEHPGAKPWHCDDIEEFKKILLMKSGVTAKEKAFKELLFQGKKPKDDRETLPSVNAVLKLLSGGTTDLDKLFRDKEYEDDKIKVNLSKSQEEFEDLLANLDEESEFLIHLRNVYDWSILYEASGGDACISNGKVKTYEQHRKDLQKLKEFVRKYLPEKYDEVFRQTKKDLNNYVAYSYHTKSVKEIDSGFKRCNKQEFCQYIKKLVQSVSVEDEDRAFYEDMMGRLEQNHFMPKQVDGDNRVIPYQLYYHELKQILNRAENHLPFLGEKDKDGYTNRDKLLAVMEFRIPYYVGPLHGENSANAWIARKADGTGRITPWNFKEKVDLDESEKQFIDRMTNSCSYLPGEKVIPKNALLYAEYEVLNEINNIKINGAPISVECKQKIYRLFQEKRKVTRKQIQNFLISNNCMKAADEMSGLDITVKSSLKAYHDFKRLLSEKLLCVSDVETIIERITYSEDRMRVKRWLDETYPTLTPEDRNYISKLKYQDFGRLSRKFLSGFPGAVKETGEAKSIIHILRETNDNLMQILHSDNYNFQERLQEVREDYYREHPADIESMLEDLRVSNAVKRPIYRTLDIVRDVKKACGKAPEKIFIEMARGGGKKNQRTDSRKTQIEKMYQMCDLQEVRELSKVLKGKSDNELQSDVLFLYFMQLGRCMYTGDALDINRLKVDSYVNIDHIYPQAHVKDDSLDNRVLVLSEQNGKKGNKYPIDKGLPGTRGRMGAIWKKYRDCGLISAEKYFRLTRTTEFTPEEKKNFINRQLVETRQSTKALAELLKRMFPDTEIVYVKAGLASDFRHEYGLVKSRQINDLHHAKDAFLNIVCGNVYHSKFTSRFFSVDREYSIKTKTVFGKEVKVGDRVVWKGESSIAQVKKTMNKNNIHYTRYAFCRKGGLFDQMPLRGAQGLVPRKEGLNPEKYGGYNKTTASFFLLAKYTIDEKKPKTDAMIVPIELMVATKVLESEEYAMEYVRNQIADISKKEPVQIVDISFPLGLRPIKVNTRFSFDGFEACLTKKDSGGQKLGFTSMMPLKMYGRWEAYIKSLENFATKSERNRNFKIDSEYDGITAEKNVELYDCFFRKLENGPYGKVFSSQLQILQEGREKFAGMKEEEQALFLLKFLEVFKTGRVNSCDLSSVGGSKGAAVYTESSKLSNWKKKFTDVRIIDESSSGLYRSSTDNLLEVL